MGRLLAGHVGVADPAKQNIPEPAEQERAGQAADRPVEQDAFGAAAEPAGSVAAASAKPAAPPSKKDEFHGRERRCEESSVLRIRRRTPVRACRRQRAPHQRVADILLAVAGQRGPGGEEERLEGAVEEVVPEPAPLGDLVEVGEDEVGGAELASRRIGGPQGRVVVGRVQDQDPLLDLLPGEKSAIAALSAGLRSEMPGRSK